MRALELKKPTESKREREKEVEMSVDLQTGLARQVEGAIQAAGLTLQGLGTGTDFSGEPTLRFQIGLPGASAGTQLLEMSSGLDLAGPAELGSQFQSYLAELAVRLRNPRPDCYVSLNGIPLSFRNFAWPFHSSTSGADTYLVHGEIHLEDGEQSPLHAKISASMTVTFAEIVPAAEQPFAEAFIYNAIRKTLDQGQLELVKSGNRQPVPVTTRYHSTKQQRFIFNDTTEIQRGEFLAAKAFWLSGVLGGGDPIWMVDPRDAQYLNTSVAELRETVRVLASEGIIHLAADIDFATPTAALMGHRSKYVAELQEALSFIKPTFNEEMRGGHTNM